MEASSWYRDWFNSPYYHKLYFDRDEKEAGDFIVRLLAHLKPAPGSRMLDLACGKGRHSRILAERGYLVTGVDLSPGSIRYARQFENPHLDFYVHDMRLPFWINYFDYVFNFFTSFGYFKTRREHDDAIGTIAHSLKPGGTFVLDYLNVHPAEAGLVPEETRRIGETVYHISRWDDETHFHKKIVVEDPALKDPFQYVEQVAKFTLGDFTEMLSYQGLQVQEVFGDYDLNPFDIRKTPRLILMARKTQ